MLVLVPSHLPFTVSISSDSLVEVKQELYHGSHKLGALCASLSSIPSIHS